MNYRKPRTCMNPRCNEELPLFTRRLNAGLCPACAFLGKFAFTLGAVLAGILAKLFAP